MSSPAPRDIVLDPEWIPHAFEADGQKLTSVLVPRARRKDLVFLTDGHFKEAYRKISLPTASVAGEASSSAQAPLHFIFHTSFCCSTLLAKALTSEGVATSLSEPNILVDLAERVIRTGLTSNQARLDLALRLLARPLGAGEKVLVKPSSFANRLIEPILAARPASRAVLLYSDVETFLTSVLRRGLLGRINARRLYRNVMAWGPLHPGFSEHETFEQTDLQIAGLAWLAQIAHFGDLARRLGPQRLVVLDSSDLLSRPIVELQRVQSFFALGLNEDHLRSTVAGPVFAKHSKSPTVDYDPHARKSQLEALMSVHSEELDMVVQWLNAVANHLGIGLRPGLST